MERMRRRTLLGGTGRCMLAALLPGCTSIGPTRLDRDQLDYARVMAEAGKRQTLFNLVRMRYGEPPAFLAIRQVVSGYTMQGTLQAGVNAYPAGRPQAPSARCSAPRNTPTVRPSPSIQ